MMTSKKALNETHDFIIELIDENDKLKKVIDILKDKWVDVGGVVHLIQCDNDTPKYYNEGLEKQYRLTQEEYDLLKEYLDDK